MSGFAFNLSTAAPRPETSLLATEHNDLLAHLVRRSPVAVSLSIITDGTLLEVNDAFLQLVGYERAEVIGRTTVDLGFWHDAGERARLIEQLTRGEEPPPIEGEIRTRTGETRHVLTSFATTRVGDRHCLLTQLFDITGRRRAEEALAAAEERYRQLVEQLPVITYAVALDDVLTLTYISPQVQTILGYSPDEVLAGQPVFLQRRCHPDDLRRVDRDQSRTLTERVPFRAEYRMRAKDGRWVWLQDEAAIVHDDQGRPLHWQGVMVDITEQRAMKAALIESEARFRSAFDESAVGMALVAPNGTFLRVNQAFADILGYGVDELLALPIPLITHPDDLEISMAQGERLWSGEIGSYQLEKRYLRKDGQTVWGQLTSASVLDGDGNVAYAIAQVQDINERKHLEARLRELASHDPLTGLLNRTALLERIVPALGTAFGQVAVLFIDLDGFKGINDALGHHAGDLLLIEIGQRLTTAVRASDSVARLGGDEFVVLLPGIASPADAVAVAERIVAAVGQPIAIEGITAEVMASIGIAIADCGSCTVEAVLRQADAALYRAKAARAGRYVVTYLPERVGTGRLELARTAS